MCVVYFVFVVFLCVDNVSILCIMCVYVVGCVYVYVNLIGFSCRRLDWLCWFVHAASAAASAEPLPRAARHRRLADIQQCGSRARLERLVL